MPVNTDSVSSGGLARITAGTGINSDAASNGGFAVKMGRLVGAGSTCQPFARCVTGHKNHGPLL
ncbi:hypothetical protein HHJ44_19915 [Escherichia coli]|nr:hypothetical protein [Escherichia coli]QJS75143.1 hypothetical protein HHJ44_19915 [Escherichia coli]